MNLRQFAGAVLSLALAVALPARMKEPDFHKKLSKDKRIVHALDRLTFGPRPGDVDRVRKEGLSRWIDDQLHPDRIAESETLEARLKPLDTLRLDPAELARRYAPNAVKKNRAGAPNVELLKTMFTPGQWRSLQSGTREEKLSIVESLPDDKLQTLFENLPGGMRAGLMAVAPGGLRRRLILAAQPAQAVPYDLYEAKIYRAVYSNRQLDEVLTDFWYNHFNVFLDKGADRLLVTSYERDAIRPHVLGKFKDLVLATAQHPAMLFYLDNFQSVDPGAQARLKPRRPAPRNARGLNENYARELMELHTLGVDGGYTQKDVIEVARCFTGWTIRNPRDGGGFYFNAGMHDPGEKTVLGVTIPAGGGIEDGLKVIDILVHHPSTARFISRELAQRFVADDPPPPLVASMARTYQKTDGDLRAVLETMLKSREFWSEGAYRAKVKSPLEMVASALRATGADVTSAFDLANQVGQLGEPLYRKIEPTGYSNAGREWMNTGALLQRMNFALALSGNHVPGAKVDAARLGAAQVLPGGARPETLAAANSGSDPSRRLALLLGSPEFQRR